jgi:hypothetical protein
MSLGPIFPQLVRAQAEALDGEITQSLAEAEREGARLAKEHAALLLIIDQSLQVAAGLEDARCKVEGMLFRMTDGRGSLGQLSIDLLQLRVKANDVARSIGLVTQAREGTPS